MAPPSLGLADPAKRSNSSDMGQTLLASLACRRARHSPRSARTLGPTATPGPRRSRPADHQAQSGVDAVFVQEVGVAFLPDAAGQIARQPGYAGIDERLVEAREGRDVGPGDRARGTARVGASRPRRSHRVQSAGVGTISTRSVSSASSTRSSGVSSPRPRAAGTYSLKIQRLSCMAGSNVKTTWRRGDPAELAPGPDGGRPMVHGHEGQGDVEGSVGKGQGLRLRTHGRHRPVPLAHHDR